MIIYRTYKFIRKYINLLILINRVSAIVISERISGIRGVLLRGTKYEFIGHHGII